MPNKTRFAIGAGALAGLAAGVVAGLGAVKRVRWRAWLHRAAVRITDVDLPLTAGELPPTSPPEITDEAHAPGHRHLHPTRGVREEPAPRSVRARPFAKQRHGLRHPGRG